MHLQTAPNDTEGLRPEVVVNEVNDRGFSLTKTQTQSNRFGSLLQPVFHPKPLGVPSNILIQSASAPVFQPHIRVEEFDEVEALNGV